MNILVTGASGFLGRHLCDYYEGLGNNVIKLSSKVVDLTDQSSLKNIPNIDYDQIFHLAAWTRAGKFCSIYQGDQWVINQQINTNILNWWKINCPKAKLIAFGTSASYSENFQMKEENYMNGLPHEKYYSYAMSKRMLLVGLETLNKQFGMNYLYLIPSTIYGPNYHTDGREFHFIYDIIRKILDHKYHKKDIVLWGDGSQVRELIYVDDFIKILYELNNKISNEIINISSGKFASIAEFAKICCDIEKINQNKINYNVNEFVGAKIKAMSIKKMNQNLKYEHKSYIKGIEATINWFKKTFY